MQKISIIIPIYNIERYLHRCLDSVLNQTFEEWQAILVDDGSTDKSGEIAEEYAAKDNRFVVVHKENGGLSDARNVGISKATGEYIMFVDGDDFIHPQTMEIIYALAKKYNPDIVSFKHVCGVAPDTEFVATSYDIQNVQSKIVNDLMLYATNRDRGIDSWYVSQCMVCMHLFKSDFIKNLKFNTDIKVMEDFVFWSQVLFKKPRACIIKIPLYYYVRNEQSLSHTATYVNLVLNMIYGIKITFKLCKNISKIDSFIWQRRFMWEFLARIFQYTKHIHDESSLHKICNDLKDLQNMGAFKQVPDFHALRYKYRILKFIKKYSA